jgi:hypothetical protein
MARQAGISKKAAATALNAFVKAIYDRLKKKGGKIRVACAIGRSVYENLFVQDGTLLLDCHGFI